MAARWGAGEETLTIGGMELFTAGGPLQCHSLEEHGSCDGLSDLALTSLDVGLLGTFQGYIDHSIISIIEDNGAQAENKGHFDEENELSLLTALTEILDNADDEKMSPFDSIPDSELLSSPKDRDGSSLQKFLSLSRTPTDREISVDDQRRVNYAKVDVCCSAPNWDLFPDTISSTPKRRARRKSIRACLPRRAIVELTLQRSDGEEEDNHFAKKNFDETVVFVSDKNISKDPEVVNDLDKDLLMTQETPCIINTENFALNDLVKYMHPYCLPALTVCIDQDDERLLDESVFLEVVSEEGETIKVPVIVDQSGYLQHNQYSEDDMPILEVIEDLDVKSQTQTTLKSTSDKFAPELDVNTENINNKVEGSELSGHSSEPVEDNQVMERMPVLEKFSPLPVKAEETNIILDNHVQSELNSSNDKKSGSSFKSNDEIGVSVPNSNKETASLKGRDISKSNRPSSPKSKSKSKNKGAKEEKLQDVQEIMSSTQSATVFRLSNPSLQESDLLIKVLDQVKKESRMEIRSSKLTRSKGRSRPSLENPRNKNNNANIKKEETIKTAETEQPNSVVVCAEVEPCSKNAEKVDLSPQSDSVLEPILNYKAFGEDMTPAVSCSHSDFSSNTEVNGIQEQVKEPKPKSVSLSEYRKRFQNRKPKPGKENENSFCSKWPSIPEPPTELAELPCLMPAKANKTAIEEKQTPSISENSIVESSCTNSIPSPTIPVSPLIIQDALPQKPAEKPCPASVDTTLPPMIPSQPNIPPPFFPPPWPTVALHPPYYPVLPSLPAVPQFPNAMASMLPIQPPPPVINWPPFPPPPIAIGPVHPTSWVPGIPPPCWPNPQLPLGVLEPPIPFNPINQHVLPEQRMPQETLVAPLVCHGQTKQSLVNKPEHSRNLKEDQKTETLISGNQDTSVNVLPSKSGQQVSSDVKKSDVILAPANTKPDLNAANQMALKIMEILKAAQKCGFQINLPPQPVAQTPDTSSGPHKPLEVNGTKLTVPKKANIKDTHTQKQPTAVVAEPSSTFTEQTKHEICPPTTLKMVKDDVAIPPPINEKTEASALTPVEQLCTKGEALNLNSLTSNQKDHAKSLDTGIEAFDLTSLLEEFEKSEATDMERLPHSPDKLAVGNSGSEKILLDKHLAPELVNTAGLTPPATPPHQLWKTVSGNLNGKVKPLHGNVQKKPCSSPLKTTKLIEPKPLPRSKLKNQNLRVAPSVTLSPVHVASGDHDYCIFPASRPEKETVASENRVDAPNPPCQMEEGSRWNVKHHKNIVIKPILQFNKLPESKACPKQIPTNAPTVCSQSTNCGSSKPVAPCRNSQKDTNYPLDHRTNDIAVSAIKCQPGSVLMSPDASPCRSENGETRTDVGKKNTSESRSLRCYRKYRNSPSPRTSPWRGRSSDSSDSSRSRSRFRSPPSKRRRKSRSRRRRSRSSSRSSYSSSSSSRSSSRSRSCSPSSSQSRSRSRSPYRRSRRHESRESYYRQKIYHKERAIEERRVVYIGKINSLMTRSELRSRFSVYGEIEECTIHFREHGDNYGFVTYRSTGQAFAAIENGHKLRLPNELPFDLCFGGRRQFCKSNYTDLDSNRDDYEPASTRSKFERLDFDTLLKQAQKSLRR